MLKIKCLFLSSLISFFGLVPLAAQTISGKILDKETNAPLIGASVKVLATNKGVVSNELGAFVLNNIPIGKLHLVFAHTGYTTLDTLIDFTTKTSPIQISLAREEADLEEVIIVSSSRTNSRIEDLPTKVEVLGSEEVHEENGIKPGNIASLLGDIAGIQIQQTNAATGNADMRIQGLQGKYTQILRDGMPLFGGYAGSFSILQIPPLDLQQIELVKGASSTLYGGGAIAGMLNLISKKPKLGKPEKSITLNYSSLKETNFNTFFSARNKEVGYSLYAGTTQQKQVDVDNDGFSDVPAVKSIFVHPRFFIYGKDQSNLTIGYTLNYEDRNGGDMQVLSSNADSKHQFFIQNKSLRNTVDLVWEKPLANGGQMTAKTNASFFDRDMTTNVFGMKGKQSSWYSELAFSKKYDYHNLVMGINFNGEQFNKQLPDSSYLSNDAFHTMGVFIQDDWKFADQFTLQSGIRVDQNNQYGTFVLPRLSLMYKLNNKVTMRIGGGQGYKTPSLFNSEMDERDYHYLIGYRNNITSEKSIGFNYDVNYKTKINGWNLTLNQTLFYNKVDKPILLETVISESFACCIPPVFYYNNAANPLVSKGMESYLQAIKGPYEIYFGYVYTDARREYNATHPQLPLIAKNKFATVFAYEFNEDFRAGIESSYTGTQYLDNGTQTEAYLFTAIMLRYNIGKASFVLNCENLFDKRQNKNGSLVIPPLTNPSFPEIWAPLDGRVINLSMHLKW
ncbi:MAG: TonB-dependent receptor [Bacteroidetes bacterium]|nr:TonB-dependent receptor [Bacteroidota bacterium]